jgi:hypothetical protein
MQSVVRYSGTFQFDNRSSLDQALGLAITRIDEDVELAKLDGGWHRCFEIHDSTLAVTVALPSQERQRFAAAEVFAVLSREAASGSVVATIDDVPIEYYTVQRLTAEGV